MLITGQSNTDWSSVTDSISHPVPAAQPSGPGPGRCSLGSKLQRVCSGRAQHRTGRQPGEGSGLCQDTQNCSRRGGAGDCSHCRRDINARREHRPARLYIWPGPAAAKVHAVSAGQLCSTLDALQCTHRPPPQPKYTQLTILQIGFTTPPPPAPPPPALASVGSAANISS